MELLGCKGKSLFILLLTIVLLSCGGGGGSGSGESGGSGNSNAPDTTAPVIPENAITFAISTEPDEITLAWLPASDDIDPIDSISYEIHASDNDGFVPDSSTRVSRYLNEFSAVIGGFASGSTYYLKAIAIDQAGNQSNASNAVEIQTPTVSVLIDDSVYRDANSISALAPTISGNTYTYSKTANSSAPKTGDVIGGQDANGNYYLRSVDNVSENAGEIVLETSDGSFSEIVEEGALLSKLILAEPTDVQTRGANRILVRSSARKGYPTIENYWPDDRYSISQTNYAEVLSTTAAADAGLKSPAGKTSFQTETSQRELVLTSSIEYEPSITTLADWDLINGLNTAEVYAEGDFAMEAVLAYEFSGSASVSQSRKIFERTYQSIYSIGAVVVHQEITLTLDAEFTANAQTEISAEAVADLLANVRFGVRYANGEWTLIDQKNISRSMTISATVQGSVDAEVRLVPNIEVKFYKAAAAGLSIEPYVKGDAEAELVGRADLVNPDLFSAYRFTELNASMGIDANIYAYLKILTKTLARYPSPDPDSRQNIFSLEYPLFSLPSITVEFAGVPQVTESTFQLSANVIDGINNDFDEESIEWLTFPSGSITVNPNNSFEAIFTPDSEDVLYSVYFLGYGETIGGIGRQFQQVDINFRDGDLDGMPDAWEIAYGLDPDDSLDQFLNPDNDGFVNSEEYANGTNPFVFDDGGTPIPNPPSNLQFTSGDSSLELNWDLSDGATSYDIYIAEVSGVSVANYSLLDGGQAIRGVNPPHLISDLVNDTQYFAVVTATNSSGESIESFEVSSSPVAGDLDLANGLVAHYRLNASTDDASGNGVHGTPGGGVSFGSGVLGQSAIFDGVNDLVSLPSDLLRGLPVGSVSLWSKIDTGGRVHVLVDKSTTNLINDFQLAIQDNPGGSGNVVRLGIDLEFNSGEPWHFSNQLISPDMWHHIVTTWDGVNSKIYIDGQLDSSVPNTNVPEDTDRTTSLGSVDNMAQLLDGSLDEIRIYNRLLTDAEVSELYSRSLQSGLIAHYEFEGNLMDSSGNSFHASGNGGEVFASGVEGQAISFNSTGLITTPVDQSILFSPGDDLTVSLWFQMPQTLNVMALIGGDGGGPDFSAYIQPDDLNIRVYGGTANLFDLGLDDGKWHHLAFGVDTGASFVYVDGVALENPPDVGSSGSDKFTIGGVRTNEFLLTGLVDDVRIYDLAITEDDIASLSNSALRSGLVAHYEFESNANDSSSSNNHGVVFGDVSFATGVIGQAASFDGLADYVQLSNPIAIGDKSNTIAAWVNIPSSETVRAGILLGNLDGGGEVTNWSIDTVAKPRIYHDSGAIDVTVGSDLNDDNWHHVAWVRDKSKNRYIIYIDGVADSTLIDMGDDLNFTSSHRIGLDYRTSDIGQADFNGLIDDLRIYDRALTAGEVNTLAGN